MTDVERYRLVILGGAGVGKSCIIRRFLLKTYTDRYRATVEDLYNREFDLGSVTIKVHIHPSCAINNEANLFPVECAFYAKLSFASLWLIRRWTSWTRPEICNFLRCDVYRLRMPTRSCWSMRPRPPSVLPACNSASRRFAVNGAISRRFRL